MDTKKCSRCGEVKPLFDFQKRAGAADGHRGACRLCENKRKAEWAKENPDSIKASKKKQFDKDPDLFRKRSAERIAKRRAADPDRARAYGREVYWRDPERHRKIALLHRERNIERARERDRRWAKENPGLNRAKASKPRKQTPASLDKQHKQDIKFAYMCCVAWSAVTGVEHHVDHIIPLRGKTVSGLHVPWNLQILPAAENLRKGNRLDRSITMM